MPVLIQPLLTSFGSAPAQNRANKTEDEKELIAPCEPYGWNHIRYSSHSHHSGDL